MMIPIILAAAQLVLTPYDWVLIVAIIGLPAYWFLDSSGLLRVILAKLNIHSKNEPSIITHSISSMIPTTIKINGVEYTVPPMEGIQSVKVDARTNETYRIINYIDDSGVTRPLKVPAGRLYVDVDNPQFLEGAKNPLVFLSDADLDAKDVIINDQKEKLKEKDTKIQMLKEELSDARKPMSYQRERQRQRRRGMPTPTSRIFPGLPEENTPDFGGEEESDLDEG